MEIKSIIVIFAKVFFSFPVNIAYWLVLVLIGFQYYRLINNETKLLGRPRNSVWEQLLSSALYGIAGGFFAAVLLFISGISLFEIGIQYVWPLALLLLFIHPRFLCFAYAGGIVGAAAALVQLLGRSWPLLRAGIFSGLFNLYIPGLLALIGILHLTESLLIALSGHLYPSPVYLETEHGIVGAFSLQKFWILPLVGMVAEVVSVAEAAGGAAMPEWWPLFAGRLTAEPGFTLLYYLLPVVAGLGYGDICISSTPRQKAKRSALSLAGYSLLLLALAFTAEHWSPAAFLAALFAPFGHEFLIKAGNKREFAGTPLYVPPAVGVKVMDLFADSAAGAAGMRPGDVIVNLNGCPVSDLHSFREQLRTAWLPLQLLVQRDGREKLIVIDSTLDLGIIPMPDRNMSRFMKIRQQLEIIRILKKKLQGLRRR